MNTIDVVNPTSGKLITSLEVDNAQTIQQKYAAARVAQHAWNKTPLQKRIEILRNFGKILEKNKEEAAETLTREVGKPISQSRNEISGTLGRLEFFVAAVEKTTATQIVLDEKNPSMREEIEHEPLGVIANISAWNYPWFVGSNV
ncbi:MAG TPA: aldehyde dehydrogenase family protein, partial [Turneriella sp.]|nr:aldehyde dehydrogenase family protein [Turneriella sp.]